MVDKIHSRSLVQPPDGLPSSFGNGNVDSAATDPGWLGSIPTLLVHATVLLAYLFFATQGGSSFTSENPEKISYDMLADAFLHGHTHLSVEPNPELLALPDPYDTEAHAKLPILWSSAGWCACDREAPDETAV
jgi:hypothetical protein